MANHFWPKLSSGIQHFNEISTKSNSSILLT
jgi:hypothetical protein